MLFDLTSRGRRSAVKIIYSALAVLMGAGFILFGVGTGVGGGGIFDIFGNGGTSASSQISAAEKRAHRETVQNPKDVQAWVDLTRARYQGAEFDNAQRVFTDAGREKLQTASVAWGRYLALDPPKPDANVALMMANAYSEGGLNQPAAAASAMEIVAAARPSAATYSQLAQYAYIAEETRKGQLAEAKAIALAPKTQKKLIRTQLAALRRQILQQQLQEGVQNGAAPTAPTPKRAPAKKK